MALQDQTSSAVDLGIIRCICPSVEDDGFTIQCERCFVWQHAFCVNITQFSIPEHYLCELCSKRKRPKLSKRFTISKKKFKHLDAVVNEEEQKKKKKRLMKSSRIISRYVYPLFKDAKERWRSIYLDTESQDIYTESPLLIDYGPFVFMDTTTLLWKGCLLDTPVYNNSSIYATSSIPSGRYLMEVTGDILLKSEFKFDPANDFVLLGTPLSHIMFYPTLDVCVDTRQFGNKAKYIRRSCHPNAELRNVIVPNGKEDKTVHLGLFARQLIERGQEVTIGWNWQRGHIAWKENMNWHQQHKQRPEDTRHKVIDEEEERRRKLTIKAMLDRFEKEFGTCACLNKRRCLIEHLRRQCIIKERPSVKRSNVNIATVTKVGRRKSSVILLKPKPEFDKLKVAAHSTNSKTDQTAASDDELLDVDGDIDIESDLPTTTTSLDNAPPLLDDHSTDEENADLSSLSSLSSFEDSDNEENKDTQTQTDTKKLIPTLLPRKKLWMRDYMNKHSNSSQNDTKEEQMEAEKKDTSNKEELFDLNEDELSDASTVLLNEEEINNVYHQSNESSTVA